MRMLDLFCGGGLAALGYWSSGVFDEIVGVDINDMSSCYSFNFIQRDCMTLDYDFLMSFDFIHASPPCQAYSNMYGDKSKRSKIKLIPGTHLMLKASGLPYVIENVGGAKKDLKPNVEINGLYFGLPMNRPRYFHVSTLSTVARLVKSGAAINIHGSHYISRETLIAAYGLNEFSDRQVSKLSIRHIENGIPPVMTAFLCEMLFCQRSFIG